MLRTGARMTVVMTLALMAMLTAGAAWAQGPSADRVISGIVTGPDGSRLPGVSLTVTDASGAVVRVVSGEQGSFRVSGLLPGRATLQAELAGFRTRTLEVEVGADAAASLDVRLLLDSLQEAVTVVGTAERESLEAPRVRESGARDVGEALSGLAGVWKVRRGAIASDVVVRGYQGDNMTVLIDGARLYGACPNNMDHTAFHVDFAEVDRIEIGKGPFDLKNQGGLGAAVNIVTKRPPTGLHLTPQFSFGSNGYVNPTITGSFGTAHVSGLVGYSYRQANPYKDGDGRSMLSGGNYKASALDSRAFDVNTAWGRVDLSPSTSHVFEVAYTRQRAGAVLYPYLQMDAGYDNADRVNVGYDWKSGLGVLRTVHAQAYATRVKHWMTDEQRTSSVGMAQAYSMATMAKTDTLGGKVEAVVPGGSVGVDVYQRGWNTETQMAGMKYVPQYSIPDVNIVSAGLYGEFTRDLGSSVRVDIGGRADYTTNRADANKANTALYRAYHGAFATAATDVYPSGKLRVTYKPTSTLSVTAGVGRTVRVPDPQERYFGLKRAGSDWVGNPFLRPTRNTGVELGASYRAGRLFLNGTVHRDALTDSIGVYQQARTMMVAGVMNTTARSYRNVDATMSGAELEGVLSITDRLYLAGDVSATRGRQHVDAAKGINSPWLSEMPPTRSRLAMRYEWRRGKQTLFAEAEGIYSAAQNHVDTDLRESPTPSYAVANVRVGGSVNRVRLSVGVSNLFDRTYVEHLSYQRDPFRTGVKVYEPGRNGYVNVAVGF